jgi:Ser/Thr protein kinase RdoA (MazF antagonist)
MDPGLRGRFAPRGFTCEILHYKPRRSCALHYQVELAAPGSAESRTWRLYGKVARDDRGVRNHSVLEAAWKASLAAGREWRAARPVAYLPHWRLLLQEAVPGRDFRVVFGELTPDDARPAQLQLAEQHLARITRAIRSLQGAPLGPGPAKPFERLHAEQERNLHYLERTEPRLAAELAAIRSELVKLERETRGNPLVFCHGDFAHGNVLIEGDRVGIIDFDKSAAAEPAYDIAYFLTHMWSFGIRHPKRLSHVAALAKGMRDAYLALAPEVSSERLALYEALDFASYVLRNFRKQSHQASWLDWAQGQVGAARERLGVAAGRKGALP